jgi:hypothetical protein
MDVIKLHDNAEHPSDYPPHPMMLTLMSNPSLR